MDELIEIKDRAWEKFCTLSGVHAVGIGKKVTGGVRTEEIGLTIFVTRKRALDELNDEAVVPPLFEGVKTDLSDRMITANFVEAHIRIGIEALKLVRRRGRSVKHLRFEDGLDSE